MIFSSTPRRTTSPPEFFGHHALKEPYPFCFAYIAYQKSKKYFTDSAKLTSSKIVSSSWASILDKTLNNFSLSVSIILWDKSLAASSSLLEI